MTKFYYKARIAQTILKTLDVALIVWLFVSVREWVVFGQFFGLQTLSRLQLTAWHLLALLVTGAVWNLSFTLLGMYHFREPISWLHRLLRTALAATVGSAAVLLGAGLIGVQGISGPVPLIFWAAAVLLFLLQRGAIFLGLRLIRHRGRNIRRVILVGLRERSIDLWHLLRKFDLGYEFLGFIDDQVDSARHSEQTGLPYLCPLDQLNRYISENAVDMVLLALPFKTHYNHILKAINACAVQGIQVRLLTDLFDLPPGVTYDIDRVEDIAFITYDSIPKSEFQQDLKRLVDVVVSTTALILLSPVFLAIAAAIMLQDGWPVFFVQERVGLNKRRFQMYKFRTMVREAEKLQAQLENLNEVKGAAFKLTNDPRVTRLGAFLRRTSLDELPQFINVLLGQMSLVGPRPLPVRDFERFYNDAHRRRFSAKPGITGLWQVSGRSDVDFDEWMKLDVYYVDNWSVRLDLRILFQTFWVVVTMKGAY